MFLESKKDEDGGTCVKARLVAGGDRQRAFVSKDDVGAPTCSLQALFLSATIDAMENRDVATIDIPNAFIQTDLKEVVHIRMRGPIVQLLVSRDVKRYVPYVYTNKKGEQVLLVCLNKALYGIMQAALLFHRKVTEELVKHGFIIKQYDPCVSNKMVEGHQLTLVWHVDDFKISHVHSKVVDEMICG